MTDKERFVIWLSQFNFTRKKIENILKECTSYDLSVFSSQKLDKLLKYDEIEQMKEQAKSQNVNNFFASLNAQNIKVLTLFSKDYPDKLKDLPDAPITLFCKGDISLLNQLAIAIVGSRTPSNYGRIITDEFARDLAKNGAVIISGLAYGVDSIAHRKTLEVGGKTIAVLGGGFNYIYPAEHTALAEQIAQKGLLISEYCPSVKPSKYTFIDRNRIIAGLCDGLLITEAGLKSGTRTTKDFALDYGRNVYAVPGSIKNSYSELPNMLISCSHAKCVMNAKMILEDFNLNFVKTQKVVDTSVEEDKIVKLLQDGEKDVEFLRINSGFDIKTLNTYLTLLEIRGIIRKLPGNSYALA